MRRQSVDTCDQWSSRVGARRMSVVPQVEMSHDAPVTIEIDPARTALVLLDYQNYNVHPEGYWAQAIPGSAERAAPAVARTAEVLFAARAAGITVIHVQNAWRDGHPDVNPHTPWQADAKAAGRSTEGTWGIEFIEALAPIAGELVVRKRAVSGFAGTELDRLLHVHDISTLVIAGIITNFAAEGTARDASDRGYRVIVLADCCESVSDELHTFAVTQIMPAIGEVVTAADFKEAVGATRPEPREAAAWRGTGSTVRPVEVAARWARALSQHDLDAAVACFHPQYRDRAPARQGEVVEGREEVRANFARLFHDVRDLRAELLSAVEERNTVWMEWRMWGTRRNGTPMEFVGVNIFEVDDDRFRSGRIYTELVREAGGAEQQLARMTQGTAPADETSADIIG